MFCDSSFIKTCSNAIWSNKRLVDGQFCRFSEFRGLFYEVWALLKLCREKEKQLKLVYEPYAGKLMGYAATGTLDPQASNWMAEFYKYGTWTLELPRGDKITRVPQEGSWRRGGNRYGVGGGIPLIEIELNSNVSGFSIDKNEN